MTSKKMWIVGGVIVAIGAVGYLSYNMPPAGNEAAGTIVEANRAVTDAAAPTTATEPTAALDRRERRRRREGPDGHGRVSGGGCGLSGR